MDDLEERCLEAVAAVRGGVARVNPRRRTGAFPDGWTDIGGQSWDVEIVTAFPELDSTAWARAYVSASRACENTGGSWHVRNGRATVLDGVTELPPALSPVDPIPPIVDAIMAKSTKYGKAAQGAILVVLQVYQLSPLDTRARARIAAECAGTPFAEIWLANEFGDPPQRI